MMSIPDSANAMDTTLQTFSRGISAANPWYLHDLPEQQGRLSDSNTHIPLHQNAPPGTSYGAMLRRPE
jgi:hypothetical protein